LFTLLTVTGVRLGEALGLTWDRVDLEAGKIEIRQGLQWLEDRHAFLEGRLHPAILRTIPYRPGRDGKTKPYLLTPKTQNGVRDLFLAGALVKILRAHRAKQAERFGINAEGLVFVTDEGTPYRDENIVRALDGYTERAKLPRVTPKGLRHSQNNFQRVVGIETVARSAGLGHLPSVNQNVYSHATEQELRKAAKLSARLIPA
jgi:integrase